MKVKKSQQPTELPGDCTVPHFVGDHDDAIMVTSAGSEQSLKFNFEVFNSMVYLPEPIGGSFDSGTSTAPSEGSTLQAVPTIEFNMVSDGEDKEARDSGSKTPPPFLPGQFDSVNISLNNTSFVPMKYPRYLKRLDAGITKRKSRKSKTRQESVGPLPSIEATFNNGNIASDASIESPDLKRFREVEMNEKLEPLSVNVDHEVTVPLVKSNMLSSGLTVNSLLDVENESFKNQVLALAKVHKQLSLNIEDDQTNNRQFNVVTPPPLLHVQPLNTSGGQEMQVFGTIQRESAIVLKPNKQHNYVELQKLASQEQFPPGWRVRSIEELMNTPGTSRDYFLVDPDCEGSPPPRPPKGQIPGVPSSPASLSSLELSSAAKPALKVQVLPSFRTFPSAWLYNSVNPKVQQQVGQLEPDPTVLTNFSPTSQHQLPCFVCPAFFDFAKLQQFELHMEEHAHCCFRCFHCSDIFFDSKLLELHFLSVMVDPKIVWFKLAVEDTCIQLWVRFYTACAAQGYLNGFFSPFNWKTWCQMCTFFHPLEKSLVANMFDELITSNPISVHRHLCQHLAYLRYLCVLCNTINNQPFKNVLSEKPEPYKACPPLDFALLTNCTISVVCPATVIEHLSMYHSETYPSLQVYDTIFVRLMAVGFLERSLQRTMEETSFEWPVEKEIYFKIDCDIMLQEAAEEAEGLN